MNERRELNGNVGRNKLRDEGGYLRGCIYFIEGKYARCSNNEDIRKTGDLEPVPPKT